MYADPWKLKLLIYVSTASETRHDMEASGDATSSRVALRLGLVISDIQDSQPL